MGYRILKDKADQIFTKMQEKYDVFAPVLKIGDGNRCDPLRQDHFD